MQPSKPATIWVVGDSTVSAFNDRYYIPRQGYGSQLCNYFEARVYNLARSGASSKDFTLLPEYRTLLEGSPDVPALGSTEGDRFLVIGFGHNDEKPEDSRYTDPNGTYKMPGSFANSLYGNYIKPALERGVIPVLCTPIARLTRENTAVSYKGAEGHITRDQQVGDRIYRGGNYRQAILDMAAQLRSDGHYVEYIDLTGATIAQNVAMGPDAQNLHSFAGAKRTSDGSLTATGLDLTHTNLYGAALNAYLISALAEETAPRLAVHSLNMPEPAALDYLAASVNHAYKVTDYQSPAPHLMQSAPWPVFTDSSGTLWHGTAFGDFDTTVSPYGNLYVSSISGNKITLCGINDCGRITSGSDALLFYYVQLPAGSEFTLSAKARINSFEPNNRTSFGLMVRDDLYMDCCISAPMGDYVAAGVLNQGSVKNFGRKSGILVFDEPKHPVSIASGTEVDLRIVANREGFALTCGKETVSAGFDYPLTGVDSNYIYAGFFVAGKADITFSEIHLK